MEVTTQDTKVSVDLDEAVFGATYNEGLVHQAVTTYLNNARSGNSAQKTRAEVRGGGRKPWNQKGSGNARAGTIRSPLWRTGGVIFAAKKRDYSQKLNKKMYRAAIRSIFSELLRQDRLIIMSDFKCDSIKTKDFKNKMAQLALNNALIIMKDVTENEYLGSRNLVSYDVCDLDSFDPVLLLKYESVVITAEALKLLEERLQ